MGGLALSMAGLQLRSSAQGLRPRMSSLSVGSDATSTPIGSLCSSPTGSNKGCGVRDLTELELVEDVGQGEMLCRARRAGVSNTPSPARVPTSPSNVIL